MALYVSCQYAPPNPLEAEPPPVGQQHIVCIDDQRQTWLLSEDSQVGDYLTFVAMGGTIDPADEIIEGPGGPSLPVPERDYGAEIDALDQRVTMLEARVLALESK